MDIDIGDIETRFKVDMSGLQEAVAKAKSMLGNIPGLKINDAQTKKSMDGMSQSATKMQESISKDSAKSSDDIVNNAKRMAEQVNKQFGNTSESGSKAFSKLRTSSGRDVDSLVRNINQKMESARSSMLKMQSLSAQRSAGTSSGTAPSNLLQLDSKIASAQAQMQKYQNAAKDLAQSMSSELGAVPDSFAKIEQSMASNEAEINRLQAKLRALKSSYAQQQVPTSGDFSSGFKMGDSDDSLKTKAQIDKLQTSMEKLIAENDALGSSYSKIEDRSAQLKRALNGVSTELKEEGAAARTAGSGLDSMSTKSGGGFFSKLKDAAGSFFNRFKSGSNEVSSGSSHMQSGLEGIGRNLKMVGAQVFLFTMLGQGLMSLIGWLWSAANANGTFAASFNQIYVNLLTAFYPIYTAVMPALNALMRGLATATGYLASFIANLFGTTYSKAKQGAAGLQSSIQKLQNTSGTGVSKTANSAKKLADNASDATKKAKELQQSLASFDEINTLAKNNDDNTVATTPDTSVDNPDTPDASSLGGADFGSAMGNYSTPKWMLDLAADIVRIAKDLWTPIAEAWDKVGDTVIASFKYMLGQILGLVEAIGKSFLKVWDNGTGEKFVENLLILLSDVMRIIGDIAKAFKDAWNDDGRGTRLIQTIFDAFNSILELLHTIATAFDTAWNSGVGESIAIHLLDIFTNIFKALGNIAEQMKTAWDDHGTGEKIFGTILGMVDDLLGALDRASKAGANWAKTIDFGPLLRSVDNLLKAIRPFTKNIWEGLEWGYENLLLPLAGYAITSLIPDFFDLVGAVLKVFTAVINDMKPVAEWLWDNFLEPIAKWTGGAFHGIMQGIVDVLTGFSDWASKHQKIVDAIVVSLMALLALKVASGWLSSATSILSSLVTQGGALGGMKGVVANLFGKITGLNDLKSAVSDIKTLSSMGWDKIKSGITGIKGLATTSWNGLKTGVSSLKEMWATASQNWNSSKLGSWLQTGPLAGATQSLKSAGGFGGLSTAGKATTGLAGAGVALGAGWDIVSAIKEKNPTKKFEDFGSGAGTAIGGGVGLFFGGPLGAAVGAQVGGTIGKWGGDGAKGFTDGWNSYGKKKKPDDWLQGLGWDAKQMSNNVVKWWDGMAKENAEQNAAMEKQQKTANAKSQKDWNNFWNGVGKSLKDTWNSAKKNTTTFGENMGKWWNETSTSFGKKWNSFWSTTGTNLKNTWNQAKTNTSTTFGKIAENTSTTWNGIKSKVSSLAGKAKDGAITAWSTLKTKSAPFFSSVQTTAKGAFDKISSGAGSLGGKIGSGLSKGFSAVKKGAASIANGIIGVIGGAVNGVIKGINWVLNKVGSSNSLSTWNVPSFATGGRHKGGPALVNDANGDVFQEAYRLPNGRTGLFPAQRNLVIDIPAGTQILPANKVANQMREQIPHYASGLFNFDFKIPKIDLSGLEGITSWAGGALSSVSSTVGGAANGVLGAISGFLDNPSGLWDWIVKQYAGISGKTGLGIDIAGGAISKMASGATAMLKTGLDSYAPASPGGTGVERWRPSVVSALKKLMLSPSLVSKVLAQISTESGGNESAMGGDDGLSDGNAEGLMQVKPGTFAAYHLAGYNNIWTGYDNILAGLNYAKSRYGSSLSFLGQGHGYANGGMIDRDGLYRVGENNLQEMVLPLTKPARALELMNDALQYMDISSSELVMPGVATESDLTSGFNGISKSAATGIGGITLSDLTAAFVSALDGAELGGNSNDTTVNAEMKVDQDTLAQVVIKAINARSRKVGHTELIF